MKKIVPFEISYKTVNTLNSIASVFLYLSTFLSLIISGLDYLTNVGSLKTFLITLNSISIVLFVFFDARASYIFTKAEFKRRLDYMDNSFGINFSGKRSQSYFTNDNVSPGFYKLCVNCFENSYHTDFIISKMFPKVLFQTLIIVLLFIISAYFGNREIVRMFFELILPLVLIQKLIKMIFFTTKISNVLNSFKLLFNDLMSLKIEDKMPDALRDILEYETTLSWASMPLETKIFNTYQTQLASDWDELKKEYNIKVE
ncbi:MAG TPA: hypothetical protein VK718_10595 [Ferruginibacter sp.]|nr:hypothetical protein [Ferruginibacter sp.]